MLSVSQNSGIFFMLLGVKQFALISNAKPQLRYLSRFRDFTLVNFFAEENPTFHFPIATAPQFTIFWEAKSFFRKSNL